MLAHCHSSHCPLLPHNQDLGFPAMAMFGLLATDYWLSAQANTHEPA